MAAKIGPVLVKLLGIKLNYRNPTGEQITRGESNYSVSTADTYVEEEPSVFEWLRKITPTGHGIGRWAYRLFPFTHWISRYNVQWLFGDLVAGKSARRLRRRKKMTKSRARNHGRVCGGASVDGVCETGSASGAVWPVLVVHGCLDLLVFRDFQRYHHRSQYRRKCWIRSRS